MPATAAASSLSEVSPVTPTAPSRAPVGVADEHPAGHRHQRAADGRGDRGDEVGLLLGAAHDRAGAHAERQRAVRLAEADLEALHRRAVLALDGDHVAAGVEDDHGQRLEAGLAARGRGPRR